MPRPSSTATRGALAFIAALAAAAPVATAHPQDADPTAARRAAPRPGEVDEAARLQAKRHEDLLNLFREMKSRGLDDLAGRLSASWSADRSLPADLRTEAILDLSTRLNRSASTAPTAARRKALWEDVDRRLTESAENLAAPGRTALLELHRATLLVARARTMLDLAEALPDDAEPATTARRWMEGALAILEGMETKLHAELDRQSRPDGFRAGTDLPRDRVDALLLSLPYQTGLALVQGARAESASKRTRRIEQARKLLEPYAADKSIGDISARACLELAEVERLAGNVEAVANHLADLLARPDLPPSLKERGEVRQAQALIAADKCEDAIRQLEAAGPPTSGERGLALFEALVRRGAQIALINTKGSAESLEKGLALLDSLEKSFGGYWGRRGEVILGKVFEKDPPLSSLAMTRRLSAIQFRSGRLAEAEALCETAGREAAERGQEDAAMELANRLGLIRLEKKDYLGAAKALKEAAERFPAHSSAPRLLLSSAIAHGQAANDQPDHPQTKVFADLLRRHQEKYPNDRTAGETAWLAGRLAERTADEALAIRQFARVPASSRHYPAAREALAGLWHDRFLADDLPPDEDGLINIRRAIAELERTDWNGPGDGAAGSESTPSSPAGDTQVSLAREPEAAATAATVDPASALATVRMVLGRLLVVPGVDRAADARTHLERSLKESKASPTVRQRAWTALVLLEVRAGDTKRASELARTPVDASPAGLAGVAARLEPDREELAAMIRAAESAVGQIIGEALLAKGAELAEEDRQNTRLLLARAQAAAGRHDDAERLFDALRANNPRDARVLISMAANRFAAGRFAECREIHQQLLKAFPRGSDEWMRSLFESVRCQIKLGRRAEALELIRATRKLYPDLGGPDLRARFEGLEKGP